MASSTDETKGKLVILGATGNTGLQLVQQALDRNYKVTAIVRSPEKLAHIQHKHLQVNENNCKYFNKKQNIILFVIHY